MKRATTSALPVPTRSESLHMLQRVLSASRDVISLVDVDGTCLYVSPACEALLGYTPTELVGLDAFAHVHPDDVIKARATLLQLVETGEPVIAQFRMVRRSGRSVWVEANAVPPDDDETAFGVGLRDITERKEIEDLLTMAALHDPVTGLPNRRLLDTDLAAAVARSERSQAPLLMLFIDLDGFKALNDRWGHLCGDDVLRSVADRLQHCVRAGDRPSRYGGDEFVVLVLESIGQDQILALVDRVRSTLAVPYALSGGHHVELTASIGVAVWHQGQSAGDLMREADAAMYRDKLTSGAGRGSAAPLAP